MIFSLSAAFVKTFCLHGAIFIFSVASALQSGIVRVIWTRPSQSWSAHLREDAYNLYVVACAAVQWYRTVGCITALVLLAHAQVHPMALLMPLWMCHMVSNDRVRSALRNVVYEFFRTLIFIVLLSMLTTPFISLWIVFSAAIQSFLHS